MDILTWGRSPWGEWILTHVSWDLLWASLFAGVTRRLELVLTSSRAFANGTVVLGYVPG